jgi:hypothetical protein
MDFLLFAIVKPNRMTTTNLAFSRRKILMTHTAKFSPAACGSSCSELPPVSEGQLIAYRSVFDFSVNVLTNTMAK